MRRQLVMLATILVLAVLSGTGLTNAGKLYIHHQRTCNKGSIPHGHYGRDTQRFGATVFAVANATTGTDELEHKPFHFRATALVVDHIRLDQVGLAIYKSGGRLVATGRIIHDGGDGGLIGNNVTIRIRAYAASRVDPVRIPPDARVVWSSEHHLWISRDRPEHISLVPPPPCPSRPDDLGGYFDEITHLEVELEYKRDR